MLVNNGGTATQPRAPGHERPHAALRAARHGRLRAASTAPGADIPRAPSARAPGQYCQSAALRAPGHGRPLATTAGALCRDRLSAALLAPGVVVSPAVAAGAPRQHRLSAAPIATVSLPAGQHRPRQEGLPYTPAIPRTLTHSSAHQDTAPTPTLYRRPTRNAQSRESRNSPLSTIWRGAGGGAQPHHTWQHPCGCDPSQGEAHPTTHQVQPAIQVPPDPRPCSTAHTGFLHQHPSRAPPAPPLSLRQKPQPSRTIE